jgi:hypothetical protein
VTARRFDVCNGDADGLCATVQWRLHAPTTATLVTGLKREIALLERVPAQAGDEVNVFDLSIERNRAALLRLLAAGVNVRYVDHHSARDVPDDPRLDALLDTASDVCTSLLVDRRLDGAFRGWALVGAYGDNLTAVADRLAEASGFDRADRARLCRLGEAINYNAYGDEPGDVCIVPATLYAVLSRYADPREMLAHETVAETLDARRQEDLALANAVPAYWQQPGCGSVFVLPDAPWGRRVLGTFANTLAHAAPGCAHAVLRPLPDRSYTASVRAPLAAPAGADALCRRFGGAGRALAAGIDRLPAADLARFVTAFAQAPWGAASPP